MRARKGRTSTQSAGNNFRFNGAAPVRARKGVPTASDDIRTWSFNGAAPVRARKDSGRCQTKQQAAKRFNGAAPVRARKDFFGRLNWLCFRQLQRGRARAGAEGAIYSCILSSLLRLQRGRARAGAEGTNWKTK